MATFNSYFPSACYSSELTGFSCFTSQGVVTVRLLAGIEFFTNTYRSDGYFSFSDYSDIVEMFMEEQQLPVIDLLIEVTDDTSTAQKSIRVLYYKSISRSYTADEMLSSGLLTTYRNRVLYPDSVDQLTVWCSSTCPDKGMAVTFPVLLRDDEGNQHWIVATPTQTINEGLNYIDISYSIVSAWIPTAYKSWHVVYTQFTFNNRTCRFYFSQAHAVKNFSFRNCFNALEYISIPTTTTNTVKTDNAVAICGKYQYQYDIVHTHTYEEQTAALDSERSAVMEQLLTSCHVRVLLNRYTDVPIIISSYTYEPSNEPNSERSFKFEWQFQYRNGITMLRADQEQRLFSREFLPQFS